MSTALNTVTLFRKAADVKRWHTKRTIHGQTVGAHSFGMLTLLGIVDPGARIEVYRTVIHHDLPELLTGDIPGPVKRDHVELGTLVEHIEEQCAPLYRDFQLTTSEAYLVYWLDKMEGALWAMDERKLGNTNMDSTITLSLTWLGARPHPNATARDIVRELVAEAQRMQLHGIDEVDWGYTCVGEHQHVR